MVKQEENDVKLEDFDDWPLPPTDVKLEEPDIKAEVLEDSKAWSRGHDHIGLGQESERQIKAEESSEGYCTHSAVATTSSIRRHSSPMKNEPVEDGQALSESGMHPLVSVNMIENHAVHEVKQEYNDTQPYTNVLTNISHQDDDQKANPQYHDGIDALHRANHRIARFDRTTRIDRTRQQTYLQIFGQGAHLFLSTSASGYLYGQGRQVAADIFREVNSNFPRDMRPFGTGIMLVLGMYKNGGTHVLVPSHMATDRSRNPWHAIRSIDYPHSASRYECLSPIYFENAEKLWAKLDSYTVKYNKKKSKQMNNRGKDDQVMENNNANKPFTVGGDGKDRIEFEHNRVLYQILCGSLNDPEDQYALNLGNVQLLQSVRFISFAYNLRAKDYRPPRERLNQPHVLDIGWTDVDTKSMKPNTGSTTHLVDNKSQMYYSSSSTKRSAHGETLSLSRDDISKSLRNLFKDSQVPIVVLVHDTNVAVHVFKHYGLAADKWNKGATGLIATCRLDRAANRERSRSPVRHSGDPRPRPRSPITERPRSHIHMVDVQSLYGTLTTLMGQNLRQISQGVISLDPGEIWCAGDECHIIYKIWKSIASGPDIDMQRKLPVVHAPPATSAFYDDGDEDDY